MKISRILTIFILLVAILLTSVFFWFKQDDKQQNRAVNGKQLENNNDSNRIRFSKPSGIYPGKLAVAIEGGPAGSSIHYSLDGTQPSSRSPVYTKPVMISKNTIIRAAVIGQNAPASPISATYLMEPSALPVFSIITDPANLWSKDKGIYILGDHASSRYPYKGANYWQDWAIPVEIHYLENGKAAYEASAGLKIFGGETRTLPQKSFALYAKKKYGSKTFDYPLFPGKPLQTYNSFVLRNGGQDFAKTHMRDGLVSTLVKGTQIDYQEYRPVVVYLNGAYWGIYDLREKIDDAFLAANHPGVKKKKIDLLESNAIEKQGSNQDYLALIDFIKNHSLKDSGNYQQVAERIDMENFIDYVTAELYFANTDWPSHNYRYWKANGPFYKWRWIIYDGDLTLGDPKENTPVRFIQYKGKGDETLYISYLFRECMKNEQFRQHFFDRADYHLTHTFKPVRVIATINAIQNQIKPEMPQHLAKWGGTMNGWEQEVQAIADFAQKRPQYLEKYLKELHARYQ